MALDADQENGPPPGASPPMRMTASWSGSERTYRIQVRGVKMRRNGEFPSDHTQIGSVATRAPQEKPHTSSNPSTGKSIANPTSSIRTPKISCGTNSSAILKNIGFFAPSAQVARMITPIHLTSREGERIPFPPGGESGANLTFDANL